MTKIAVYVANVPPAPCGVGDYTHTLVGQLSAGDAADLTVFTHAANPQSPQQRQVRITSYRSLVRLARQLEAEGFAILVLQYQAHSFARSIYPNLLIMYLRARTRIKTVLVMHDFAGPLLRGRFGTPLFGRLINFVTLLFSNRVIVTDSARLAQLERYDRLRLLRNKTSHVPVGSAISPVRTQPAAARKDLCFFGLVHPTKNVAPLIAAFGSLLERQPQLDATLYIIGESLDPAYQATLAELAGALPDPSRVVFTGYCGSAEVSALLERMRLCVLPYEGGLPYSTSSAAAACIAHGVPMIGTRRTPGEAWPGVLPIDSPVQPDQLRAALGQLLTDDRLYERLRAEIEHSRSERSWPTIGAAYQRIFEQLGRA